MMTFRGGFLLKNDKDYTVEEINKLCEKHNNSPDYSSIAQEKACYRNYFHDVSICLHECFYEDFGCNRRAISFMDGVERKDDINSLKKDKNRISFFIAELRFSVPNAVSINDFPSCKDMLMISPEELLSAINDHIENKFIKGCVSIIMLGKGVENAIKIDDVQSFYDNLANEMQSDIIKKV